MTDYVQFVLDKLRPYSVILPRLRAAMQHSGAREVVDLCSAGGGPWGSLAQELDDGSRVRLTDRYPNIKALERLRARCEGKVEVLEASGLPLGIERQELYIPVSVRLAPGDTLLLVTDGITEARRGRAGGRRRDAGAS